MQRRTRESLSDRKSESTWEALAKEDPFHAVLTNVDAVIKGGDSAARAAFYRSGEEYLERLFAAIGAHFGSEKPFRTAADFGCGVGRVAVPLARRCGALIAVDVSPTMRAMTEEYARQQRVDHLAVQSLTEFLADDLPLDLLHSVLVLQHIWPEDGFRILSSVLPRIRVGGLVVLHVPYLIDGERTRPFFRWVRSRVPGCNAIANVLRGKPVRAPYMQMNAYDLNRLVELLHRHDFGDLVLLREWQEDVLGVIAIGRRES